MPYSYVGEPSSTADRPHILHYAAHASLSSVYLPVLCEADSTCPVPLASGSMRVIDRSVAYWTFRTVRHSARGLVWDRCLQMIRQRQVAWESKATAILDGSHRGNRRAEASQRVTSQVLDNHARAVVADWWAMLDEMLVRFGDGSEVAGADDGAPLCKPVAYPTEWLEAVADWEPLQNDITE